MDNHLFESASEGLFIYKGGNSVIYGNKIYSNYDGIILNQSFSDIKFNKISDNKENGIMLIRDSDPQLQFNDIRDNKGIGVFVRDISEPDMKDNNVVFNQIDFASDNVSIEVDQVQMNNTMGKNVYKLPVNKCRIF